MAVCSQKYVREEVVSEQIDRTISRVALESALADEMLHELETDREAAFTSQQAAIVQAKADMAACDKQTDMLLDMRLNEQISETEYVSKKHALVNRKAELRGMLEAFEVNRRNRFEPVIEFVKEAKQATFLLAEGKAEEKRDFLKKIGSNLQLAEKSLTVEFKMPWFYLAEFNSKSTTSNARERVFPEKSEWRRGGDSNPRAYF